jgi:anti-sigma factor RsiW
MNCLDIETLSMHLDRELELQQHKDVVAHLRTCSHCAERLRTLQTQAVALRSGWSGVVPTPQLPGAACCRAEDLSAYASGLLSAQEDASVEQHLATCDVCLHEVMAVRGTLQLLQREPLLAPPASLVATVQQGLTREAPPSGVEKLGTLILQLAADGLKFVEALLLPEHVRLAVGGHLVPVGALRSAPGNSAAVTLLDIRQQVRDLDVHLQVLQEEPQTVLCTIRVAKQGQPWARKRVSIARQGRLVQSSTTSAQGEVAFPSLPPGEYTVRLPQENVETQIVLRAANEHPQVG